VSFSETFFFLSTGDITIQILYILYVYKFLYIGFKYLGIKFWCSLECIPCLECEGSACSLPPELAGVQVTQLTRFSCEKQV